MLLPASPAPGCCSCRAQVQEPEGHIRRMSADHDAAARVPQLEARILQLESQLQTERRAGKEATQLRARVQQLEAEAQRMERDRAKDRAQMDAFHGQPAGRSRGGPDHSAFLFVPTSYGKLLISQSRSRNSMLHLCLSMGCKQTAENSGVRDNAAPGLGAGSRA